MKKISVILPVFNEAEGIAGFHAELSGVLKKLSRNYRFEVIYVADKSTDATVEMLKKISQKESNVIVLELSRRFGHQASIVAGLDSCTGDAAIMMDSDLEHPPEYIPDLLKKFEEGYDIVNTVRTYSGWVSPVKKFFSGLYYKFLNFLADEKLMENSADFRLVSRKVLEVFREKIREHNQYLRGIFSWVGFKRTTVAFTSGKRLSGRGKYSLRRLLNFGLQGIVSFSKMPLRMSITLGILTMIAGACYVAYVLVYYFQSKNPLPGWTSIIALVTLFGGMQLIVLGVIGEYIAAIFDETKNRPLYIVENRFPAGRAKRK